MHELSIASSIVKTVLKEIDSRNLKVVTKIGLKIGALTDIVPDSLTFGFDAITKDTILSQTILEIKTIPIKGHCNSCHSLFEVFEFIFICPNCSSGDLQTPKGNELEIAYLETEE